MNSMDTLEQTLVKLAAVADRIDARSAHAVQRIEASASALEQGVQNLSGGGERFAHDALRVIGTQTQQAVASGTERVVGEFNQQLQQSAGQAKWASEALAEQRMLLSRAQHALIWKGMIALVIGSLLAVAGSGFIAWNSLRKLKQARFGEDILHATQVQTLTRCGDALCAKVGKKPQRYGKDDEYVLLVD